MEAAGVAEDQGGRRASADHSIAGRHHRLHGGLRRVRTSAEPSSGRLRPEMSVLATAAALRDVLQGPSRLVDLVDVEEHFDRPLVLGIAVPVLRGQACSWSCNWYRI